MKQNNELLKFDDISFDNCAVITFQTHLHGFQLAALLNHCLHLSLSFIDSSALDSPTPSTPSNSTDQIITLDPTPAPDGKTPLLPTFTHHDQRYNLTYNLFDTCAYSNMPSSLANALQQSNNILLIRGMGCHTQQKEIFSHLSTPQTDIDPDDIIHHHEETLWRTLANNIIDYHYYNFSDPDQPLSSQWSTDLYKQSAKLRRMVKTIKSFFADLIEMADAYDSVPLKRQNLPISK